MGRISRPIIFGSPLGFSLSALCDWHIVAARRTNVELARTPDLLMGILDHLFPLRDPARRARDREEHGEHGHREAHRLQRDPGIEIDIWIKLLLDEIFIATSDSLEFNGDIEQRTILDTELVQDLVTGLLHELGARIIVLIDAVAETHEPEGIV